MEALPSCPAKRRSPDEEGLGESEPRAKRRRNSNAGYYCSVPCCSSRSIAEQGGRTLSFHRFPADKSRRALWIAAVRRDVGADFQVTGNTRVCSKHFEESDFLTTTSVNTTPVNRRLRPTAVPSVFAWSVPKKVRRTLTRVFCTEQQCKTAAPTSSSESAPHGETPHPSTAVQGPAASAAETDAPGERGDDSRPFTPAPSFDHCYSVRTEGGAYVNELLDEVSILRCDLKDAQGKLLSLDNAKKDPGMFKHLTGLPNHETFSVLLTYLDRKARRLKWWRGLTTIKEVCRPGGGVWRPHKTERKLSVEEQFFAILVRLRTGASLIEMATRLGISKQSFSRMFITWINFLMYELRAIHKFPKGHPRVLISSFKNFLKTRIIIDCTEVFTKRPSGLHGHKQLFSNYKHHNTVKFFIGIAACGAVSYVSGAWGGRASDQKITSACGLLDELQPGQDLMADRGFSIESLLVQRGCRLIIPSFLGSTRAQLSAEEVTSTRRIAEARIHVERAIERMKEFRILQGEVEVSLLHVVEQIFQVCAFLTNFQAPIANDVFYCS